MPYHPQETFSTRPYEEIRQFLHPEYRNASAEDIEDLFDQVDIDAEALENFLETLNESGRGVGQGIGATAGAALGTLIPIPGVGTAVGGLLGKGLGGAVGGLFGKKKKRKRRRGRRAQKPVALGSDAAAQLVRILFRPEVIRALMSMFLGPAGRRSIPVAGKRVPPAAFANLVDVLASQAVAEYHAVVPTVGEGFDYLTDYAGETVGDPAVAEQRAAVLLELLQEAELDADSYSRPELHLEAEWESDADLDELELEDQFYDEMDLTELYTEYEAW